MIIFEILVVIVLLAFVANGIKAGAIETLGRVLGAVLGFLAARAFAGWFIGVLSLFISTDWAFTISFLIIFLAVDYLVGLLFKFIENILKILTRLPILKQITGLLGGIFGCLEGIVVIGGISWLITQAAATTGTDVITNLRTIGIINKIFTTLFSILL
ncbi:hypothetical protein GF380_05935 [Candidatus Uhrbacteria bacterium]|nr:hypothetical protein [Candidatus Uhrbacteria bacterium]MBD3284526.1 hypothetical protein [Candidatus Uhrbacteria bacterium]